MMTRNKKPVVKENRSLSSLQSANSSIWLDDLPCNCSDCPRCECNDDDSKERRINHKAFLNKSKNRRLIGSKFNRARLNG